jgi:hypothetical protein
VNIQQANSIAPPSVSTVPLGQAPNVVVSPAPTVPAADLPPAMPAAAPAGTPPAFAPAPVAPTQPETPAGLAPLPARTGAESGTRPPAASTAPDYGGPMPPQSRGSLPEIQYVRDGQVAIEFTVERQGPSGIKKIQVYRTLDDGRTWGLYWETPPNQTTSPLKLPLPKEEGLYGFRLVLFSGVDQSVGPPRTGDKPDIRLQVDRTPPALSLYPPTINPNEANGLLLHYYVYDANLDPKSVSLYWSHQPGGDWKPMAIDTPRTSTLDSRLKECTWTLPPELLDHVYLRLTACDLAGNQAEYITRDPVTVDLHKPTARVTGVITVGQQRK